MVDSRDKGMRTEIIVRDLLRKHTGLKWERTPLSGALNAVHGLKADLYVPNEKNKYCIEVKGYAEDHLTSKLLTSKTPQLITFWEQCIRQADQVGREPLLIYKFDRSKCFVGFAKEPTQMYNYVTISVNDHLFHTAELETWLKYEKPIFV